MIGFASWNHIVELGSGVTINGSQPTMIDGMPQDDHVLKVCRVHWQKENDERVQESEHPRQQEPDHP